MEIKRSKNSAYILGYLRRRAWIVGLSLLCIMALAGIILYVLGAKTVAAYFFSSILLAVPYSFFVYILCITRSSQMLLRLSSFSTAGICIVAFACNLFIISIITRERFVYFWDYSGYWLQSLSFKGGFYADPLQTLKQCYHSINYAEYNSFCLLFVALPLQLVGPSFIGYVLVVTNFFLLPFCLILSLVITKFVSMFGRSPWVLFVFSLVCLCSILWLPITAGYVDAAGLLGCSLFILVVLEYDFTRFSLKISFCTAVLSLIILFLRRYYAYFVLGSVLALFLTYIIRVACEKQDRGLKIRGVLFSAGCIGGTLLMILFIFFWPFVKQMWGSNGSISFSAYKFGTTMQNIGETIMAFGILPCLVASVGSVLCILLFKIARFFIVFLFSSTVFTTLLFINTQSMGTQHRYIISSQIIILAIATAIILIYKLASKFRASDSILSIFFVGMLLYSILSFSYSYRLIPSSYTGDIIFSEVKYVKKYREDIMQIQILANTLNHLADNDKKIYVLASSTVLNSDILENVNLPYELNSVPSIVGNAHVDLRDGFYPEFFDCDIIVVADPPQTHLRPEDQQVVILLAELMLGDTIISDNFTLIDTQLLKDHVRVHIYLKNTPFSIAEMQYVAELFDEKYRDYPALFVDRITKRIQLGE